MNPTLVSVVMSVFNEEDFLADSIDSILNQTLADFEFIIIDDGSTDETSKILEKYRNIDKRIKIFSNISNLGIARSRNRGIRAATGKYIAIMDAGDLAYPQKFEKQVEFMEANEDLFILGTQGKWINEEGKTIGNYWNMPLKVDSIALYRTGGAIDPSIMAERALFDLIGLYNENLVMSLEFELYLRCLSRGLGMANLRERLVCVRERREGMTMKHIKIIQKNQLKLKLIYLPRFFCARNAFYTVRSLAGYILPSFVLIRIIKLGRRSN
jgi:glycosyltransferase involved in cell wall biosynthesis